MKLVKIDDVWYANVEGQLRSSSDFDEDFSKWKSPDSVPTSATAELSRELGGTVDEVGRLNLDSSGTSIKEVTLEDPAIGNKFDTYHSVVAAAKAEAKAEANVKEVTLEDPAIGNKFDTYHSVVAAAKAEAKAEANVKEVTLEDPAIGNKFDTYHAAVVATEPEVQ